MMRTLLLIAFTFILSAQKCSDGDGKQGSEKMRATELLDSKWEFTSVNGQDIDVPVGSVRPWLQLSEVGTKASGHNGCNTLFGTYTMNGSALSFTGIGTTKMYCETTADLERQVMEAIRNTDGVKMEGETVLLLQGERTLAHLVKGE